MGNSQGGLSRYLFYFKSEECPDLWSGMNSPAEIELVYWWDGTKANQSYSLRNQISFGMGAKVSEMDTTRRYSKESGGVVLRDSRES